VGDGIVQTTNILGWRRKPKWESKRLANGVSSGIFRDGSGVIGTISTIGATTPFTIQLTEPAEIVQFELNQAIQAWDGSTLKTTAYVVRINRDSGTLSISSSLGGSPTNPASLGTAWVTTDKLLTAGTLNLQIKGLNAWLTDDAVALAAAYFGVIRNKDQTRLAGVIYDGSALSVKDALVNAINRLAREGSKPDYCFMDFESIQAQ